MINTQANEWNTISFNQNLNFYYKNTAINNLKVLDSVLSIEFHAIEQKINYNTNQSIDIYLHEDSVFLSKLKEDQMNPGEIPISKPKVVLKLFSNPKKIRTNFKFQVSKILVEEMIFGYSIEDKIKYSNILRQPRWLMPGLYFYLSDQWSEDTDNEMRSLHMKKGFSSIDLAPKKYHQLLSASFWKYIEHNYGSSSIYSLLYMIRLTQNFSSAVSYTFKNSLKIVFEEWELFYKQAYQLDHRIPAPINGIPLSKDDVIEILVESDSSYYSLEKTLFGSVVFRNNILNGSRRKVIKLSSDETPLPAFSGALFYHANKIHLALQKKSGILIYDDVLNNKHHFVFPIKNPNHIVSNSNHIFMSVSNVFESKVYRFTLDKLDVLISLDAFISSFDIDNNKICVSVSSLHGNNLYAGDTTSISVVYSSKKPIDGVLFADESTIIFNHSRNGILNSKMISTDNSSIKSLTNFRFNILYHKFDKSKFIEIVDKGNKLEMFTVSKQPVKQYYIYDTIPNTFFENFRKVKLDRRNNATSYILNNDSLTNVSYQIPVSPMMNYAPSITPDIGANSMNNQISSSKADLNYYEFSKIKLNLTNNVFKNDRSMWFNSFETLMPSNLHLSLGASAENKKTDNEISANYVGLIQPNSMDLILKTAVGMKKKVAVNLMHRQRVIEGPNSNNAYTTDLLEVIFQSKTFSSSVELNSGVQFRYDKNSPYYINEESMTKPIENKFQLTSFSELAHSKQYRKNHFKNSLSIEPNIDLAEQSWNISLILNLNYERKINSILSLKTHFKAATSQGNSPNYYMIGGKSNDLLSKITSQSFSDFRTPLSYESLYGVRGFSVNHRNGNSAAILKSQLDFKILQLLYNRPISNQFFSDIKFHLFADFGTAFYGRGIYARENILGRSTLSTSTKTVDIQVNAFRDPSIMSFGSGFSSSLFRYKIQFDYAIGIDDRKIHEGIFHIGLGKSF